MYLVALPPATSCKQANSCTPSAAHCRQPSLIHTHHSRAVCLLQTSPATSGLLSYQPEGGREGGREGGVREGWRGGREGVRERGRGREGGRGEGGREWEGEGGREGKGREGKGEKY